MRKILLPAIIVLAVAVCATSALATPSTLIWIPSTDIQAAGVPHLGLDTYAAKGVRPVTDLGLTLGLGGKFEYGIDVVDFGTDPNETGVWFNAKYMIVDEKPGMPRIVAGAYNVGSEDDFAPNFIYLLGSKTTKAARFTAGVATGRESVLITDETMLLLGVDKSFNDKWWGAIDYQGGKSGYGALSAGISYLFNPNTSLILGYDVYNDSALKDTVTVQLDMNF